MAFGIDDALATAATGINLADTIVETIKKYRSKKLDFDFEQLISEVKTTMLGRIDDADLALTQFERMLVEKKIDIGMPISDVIAKTSMWRPFEQHRLNQIRRRFNEFSDSAYSVGDDIAALARCREQTTEIGISVVQTIEAKHKLHSKLLNAHSLKEAIDLLRARLADYKKTLSSL